MPSETNLSGTTTSLSYIIPNNVPVRKGYTFKGWSSTSTGPVEFDATDIVTVPAGTSSITTRFYAVWQKTTANYKVEWYDEAGNVIKTSEIRTGVLGSIVSVTDSDKVVDGYTFVKDSNGNKLSDVVRVDGDTVLKLYFTTGNEIPKEVDTSDNNNTFLYVILCVLSLGGIISLSIVKNKKLS